MKKLILFCLSLAVVASCAIGSIGFANQISLNFSENSGNQGFTGGELIGPLSSDSTNWNNTNGQPNLVNGTLIHLIDDSGADTGASVTWAASNPWYNNDGTLDDEHKMAVGYLDDGPTDDPGVTGVIIDIANIPYANYRVYGLLANDHGNATGEYDTLDFTVNGTQAFGAVASPAYGNIEASMTATGQLWSHADGTTRGNYWTVDTSGSNLLITGLVKSPDGPRGSITGVIIQQLPVPEPASAALLALAGCVGFGIRRRND